MKGLLEHSLLGPGEVIGLALVDDRSRLPSDSTYECSTPVVKCLILDAMEYKDILKAFQVKESAANQQFLKKIKPFSEWS